MPGPEGHHLSDDEIDLYAARRLPEERLRGFEEHYLECGVCRRRVEAVLDLVEALAALPRSRRRLPLLPAAAALLAGVTVFLALEVRTLRERLRWGEARPHEAPSAEATALPEAPSGPWLRFALGAPVRGAGSPVLRLRPDAGHVLLAVDAREAGAPGAAFEVAVRAGARALCRFSGLRSTAEGEIFVPVPAALLGSGDHAIAISPAGEPEIRIAFRVERLKESLRGRH